MKAVCIKNASIGEQKNLFMQLNIYEILEEVTVSFTMKDKNGKSWYIAKPGKEKYQEDPHWPNFVDHFRIIET